MGSNSSTSASVSIERSTIASNATLGPGGGIRTASGATLSLRNTIVARNSRRSVPGVDIDGDVTSLGHNLIRQRERGSTA